MLTGWNVALGVTGSIAAVRTVELAHELRRRGATVRAVTTPAAHSIVHPWALEYATEHPVTTELTGAVEHVDLCGSDGWADVLLIAPATANTIGKIAAAVDDTPVTTCATTAIGAECPVVVAPAMHQPMWDHPGVLDAIERLESWGIEFVPPRIEEGKAKIAADEAIVTAIARTIGPRPLEGTSVVVTSGPTSEPVDPVRILTNRSSGRTGRAIARALYVRGADVTLLHDGPDVHYATVEAVETSTEMTEAAVALAETADALISAAAIGDFHIDPASDKLDSGQHHRLELTPAPKLLDAVRETNPSLVLVGFKAEHASSDDELVAAARSQRERVGAAFVVANDAAVMGGSHTRVVIVGEGSPTVREGSKEEIGAAIADRLVDTLSDPGRGR